MGAIANDIVSNSHCGGTGASIGHWVYHFSVYRRRKFIAQRFSPFNKAVILLATAAFIIKLILQLGSTIPALSTWAYGYRPMVHGYILRLVLLGVITLSLLAIAIHWQWIRIHVITKTGMIVFISGLILNELGLLIQGLSAIAQFDIICRIPVVVCSLSDDDRFDHLMGRQQK